MMFDHQLLMTYMEEKTLNVPSGCHQAMCLSLSETELYKAAVLLQNPRRLLSMEVHPNTTKPTNQLKKWANLHMNTRWLQEFDGFCTKSLSKIKRGIISIYWFWWSPFPFGQVPLAQAIRAAPRSRATSKVRLDRLRIESEQGWQGNVTRLSFKEMKSTVYREQFQIL